MTDTSMSQWETFADGVAVLGDLKDLNLFTFNAELPMTVIWANDEVRLRVAQLVYDEVLEVLRVSGLYRYDQLAIIASAEQIIVRYTDDRYGFEVALRDETLVISRQGSSFARFHRWYVEVAPHFAGLVAKVSAAIEEAIRSATNLDRRMPVQSAHFNFRFIIYDVLSDTGEKLLNSQVLEDLVPRSPGPNGSLGATESETKSIARLDASFQKWQERDGKPWIEVYNVEAPSNRDWSSIWITFSMSGRSFERPSDGARVDFDAASFISDYVTPLVEFLRERGLKGFLTSVLVGRRFSTTAGSLP